MISERTFPILILGDCLNVLSKIPDKSIDMILCDLPYETLNKGNSNASWDRMIPLQTLWAQYERIIKDNGAIVLFSQGLFTSLLMSSNPKLWRYNLVWDKVLSGGFLNARRMPLRVHEDICVFYKKLPVYNPQMSIGKPLHGRGTAYKSKTLTNNCYGSLNNHDNDREGCTEKFPTSILRFPKPKDGENTITLLKCLSEKATTLDSTIDGYKITRVSDSFGHIKEQLQLKDTC